MPTVPHQPVVVDPFLDLLVEDILCLFHLIWGVVEETTLPLLCLPDSLEQPVWTFVVGLSSARVHTALLVHMCINVLRKLHQGIVHYHPQTLRLVLETWHVFLGRPDIGREDARVHLALLRSRGNVRDGVEVERTLVGIVHTFVKHNMTLVPSRLEVRFGPRQARLDFLWQVSQSVCHREYNSSGFGIPWYVTDGHHFSSSEYLSQGGA
mmetsp:Transcript_47369/g.143421  ORF Transcript_47369/g.143421 Transcript_47369/m.143421 type:complete len:209 (+) Transcript_47369:512-1138(+)